MSPDAEPTIRFDADVLRDEARSLRLEWLATNGLGGYASSTLAGANTRRYHGLLVAALKPPVSRAVLLSKLEETIEVTPAGGITALTYALSCNLYPGVTYPQGHKLLDGWTSTPVPTWTWTVPPGLRLEKRVWMEHGKNATCVSYRLLESPPGVTARLHLDPLLAWKDYHREMRAGDAVPETFWYSAAPIAASDAEYARSMLQVSLPGVQSLDVTPVTLRLHLVMEDGSPHPAATFLSRPCWYYSFQHPREQERGFDFEEDLCAVGTLTAPLDVGQCVTLIATTEEGGAGDPRAVLAAAAERRRQIIARLGDADAFAQDLAIAADQFVVEVPGGRTSIIAGYHWFADWGRDTMISLPGLCLATLRPDAAREILASFAEFVNRGMLPNRFPDSGEPPEYNTVDATLWYFAAVYRYVAATGDVELVRDQLWSVLDDIITNHRRGTRFNIRVEPADHLLYAGQPGVQLTWMDARVGDWVVTPRIGKPVEINALWHNALATMESFARQLGLADAAARYGVLAKLTRDAFAARFARPDGHGLYDVLDTPDGNRPDAAVRPNQVFAVSLPFAPVAADDPLARQILEVIAGELFTPVGLRTLSPLDSRYQPRYEGDQTHRDAAYHQGTVWPWLLPAYAEAHFRVHGDRAAALELLRPLAEQTTTYGIGQLAEIFDGSEPQRPNGCIAQAWSVGETLRVWRSLQET